MYKRMLSVMLLLSMILSLVPSGIMEASPRYVAPAIEWHDPSQNTHVASVINTTAQSAPQQSFADIKASDWFYGAVMNAVQNGIFSGTGNDRFSPGGTMTRGMYVTALGRMAGIDVNTYTSSVFSDVQPGIWYAPYVQWAVEKGITSGTADKTFSPDIAVSREQMAALTLRYFESEQITYQTGVSIATKPNDISAIAPWAHDAVIKLWQAGLLTGDLRGNFNPESNATRAEAATFLMRTHEVVTAWGEMITPSSSSTPSPASTTSPSSTPSPASISLPASTSSPASTPSPTSTSSPVPTDQSGNNTTYTITFESNGGSPVDSLTLNQGVQLNHLPLAFKTGSIFNGWYKDSALTEPIMTDDIVTSNMTLYARYSASPDQIVKSIPNANAMDQEPGFTVAVKDSTGAMTAAEVQAGMTFSSPSNPDFPGIVVNGSNGNFTVAAQGGAFEEGATYQITLTSTNLAFTDKDPTTKIYVFSIAKQEVMRLPLNTAMQYIPYSDVTNMTQEGEAVTSPSISVMNANVSSGRSSLGSANYTSGSFQYDGTAILKAGDTVSIYEGIRPDLRTLDTSDEGNIAYVVITEKNGDSYSYTNADPQNVLFKPSVLPVDPASDTDGDSTNHSITVAAAAMDYSDSKYAPMGLNATTVAREGDYLALVNMTTGADLGYGKVTSVTSLGGSYVIAYADATQDDITHTLDFYKVQVINGSDILPQAEIAPLEAQIEQQALSSGFVDTASNYLATTALQTQSFTKLSTDLAPQALLLSEDSPQVSIHNLQVSADIGTKLDHFQGKSGLKLNLTVSADIQVSTGGDNDIIIHMSATFVEELSLSVGADASTVWGYIDLGLFDLPYPKDFKVSANLDAYTFTNIDVAAQIGTIPAATPLDQWTHIWDSATNRVDIAAQFKSLLRGDPTAPAAVNADTLVDSYQAMLENDTDWVDLVEQNLVDEDLHLISGLIHVNYKADFVISLNPNVTLGIGFSYETAKRYIASFQLSEGYPRFDTVSLQGDGTYHFYFYVMGSLELRAGLRFQLAAGLFHVDLNSIGITAETGVYLKLYGYFYYEVSSSATRTLGALFLQIGIYLEEEFGAQIGGGSLSYNESIYSAEWPLYTVGSPVGHFIGFAYDQSNAPSFTAMERTRFGNISEAFTMKDLNLLTGEVLTQKVSPRNFTFSFDNKAFAYNPDSEQLTVSPKDDENKVDGVMTVTWSGSATGLDSTPVSRKIALTWYRSGVGSITLEPNSEYLEELSHRDYGQFVLDIGAKTNIRTQLSKAPIRAGYTFNGWTLDPEGTQPYTIPEIMPASNITVYAQWTPKSNVEYYVDYNTVDPNTGEKTKVKSNTFSGAAGASISPEPILIEGYVSPPVQTTEIRGNASTKIAYDYERAVHKMTFYSEPGGTAIEYSGKSYSTVPDSVIPKLNKRGYTFAGWSTDLPSTMPSSDTTYTATWTPSIHTPYRVSYRLQAVGSDPLYVEADTGSFQGTTGEQAQPSMNSYTGYTYDHSVSYDSKGSSSGAIAADGSLVIVQYYTRNSYNLTFDANGGTGGTSTGVQYGAVLLAPAVTKLGGTFVGWTPALPQTMPAQDVTYTAQWDYAPIAVEGVSVDNLSPQAGDTLTATVVMSNHSAAGSQVSYQWQVETDVSGTYQPAAGTDNTSASYKVMEEEIGKKLRVVVTGVGPVTGTSTSSSTNAVQSSPVPAFITQAEAAGITDIVQISGTVVSIASSSSVSLLGNLTIPSGITVELNGPFTVNAGQTLTINGTVNIRTGGELTAQEASTLAGTGIMNVYGKFEIETANVTMNLTGMIKIYAAAQYRYDTRDVLGGTQPDIMLSTDASLELTFDIGRIFYTLRGGDVAVRDGFEVKANESYTLVFDASLTIGSGDTFTIVSGGEFHNNGTFTNNGLFTNNGTFNLGFGTFINNGTFNDNGTGEGGEEFPPLWP